MATYVTDPFVEGRLRADREASGGDRFDEVWEGVYFMPPLANDEHQELATRIGAVLQIVVGWDGPHRVYVGVNVSDREEGWEDNYRIPDVAVFLEGGPARDCGTHWCGGPDFAIEILSPGDRSREKLAFYAGLGVRELLLIDRDPWAVELYQNRDGELIQTGQSSLDQPAPLASETLPLTFCLRAGRTRPILDVAHTDGVQRWSV
jgi:Uma2 family endonuclease